MSLFSTLDDDVVDALLEGHALDDASELDELAAVMRRLRTSADREPIPPMSATLRSQLTQPNVVPLGPIAHARRSVRAGLLAAAAAAAVVVIGVGAEQNRLPADLQDVVASVADLVGVDVPRTEDRPAHDDADGDADAVDAEEGTSGSSNGKGDGATPADPGEPGDKEPATPATPPEHSSGGGVEGGGVEGTPGATAPGQDNAGGAGGNGGNVDTEVVTGGAPPSTTPPSTTPTPTTRGGSNRPTTTDGELESEPPGGSSTADTAPGRGKK